MKKKGTGAGHQLQLFGKKFAKDELNLAEFPWALLTSQDRGVKTLEFKDEVFVDRAKIQQRWTVTASDKYGMPRRDDVRVYIGLMQLTTENADKGRTQFFTRYQLARAIGWPADGPHYDAIQNALNRLKGVSIVAEDAFYDLETRAYKTVKGFSIIDNYELTSDLEGGSYFTWNEVIWNSIMRGFTKDVDSGFYNHLESGITKRLYRYLNKKFYQRNQLRFELRVLAYEKIGLSRTSPMPKIRQQLTPCLEELQKLGYLESFCYDKVGRKDYVKLAKRTKLLSEIETSEAVLPAEVVEVSGDLIEALIKKGVSKAVAADLSKNFPAERIKEKLEFLDYMKKKGLTVDNPPGFLVDAIKENYSPPAGFVSSSDKKRRDDAAREQAEVREKDFKKKEFVHWLKNTDDEKVAGLMILWEVQFKREQRRLPTGEEVAEQRRYFVHNLPTPIEKWEQEFPGEDYPHEFSHIEKKERKDSGRGLDVRGKKMEVIMATLSKEEREELRSKAMQQLGEYANWLNDEEHSVRRKVAEKHFMIQLEKLVLQGNFKGESNLEICI